MSNNHIYFLVRGSHGKQCSSWIKISLLANILMNAKNLTGDTRPSLIKPIDGPTSLPVAEEDDIYYYYLHIIVIDERIPIYLIMKIY